MAAALNVPQPKFAFAVAPMTVDDLVDVSRVERRCFTTPWPMAAYRRELRQGDHGHYIILRATPTAAAQQARPKPRTRLGLIPFGRWFNPDNGVPVAGFAGMWLMFGEAHVTTIGVDPVHQGQGLGELLLLSLIVEAIARGSQWMTLEVRVSNHLAQALYQKYGFTTQHIRPRYYSDNGEDAWLMSSRPFSDRAYRQELEGLRHRLAGRLDGIATVPHFRPGTPIVDPQPEVGA